MLNAGILRYPEDRLIRQLLGTTLRLIAETVETNTIANVTAKLQLLQAALGLDPLDEEALRMVAKITQRREGSYDRSLAALRQTLASGKATALSHACMGIIQFNAGDAKASEFHLRRATDLGINAHSLLANLSTCVEPHRALELITLAIEHAPDRVELRALRGRLLAQQERWREALQDLEFAASRLPDRQGIERLLKQVRDKMDI